MLGVADAHAPYLRGEQQADRVLGDEAETRGGALGDLRGLALANPAVCEDCTVLYDDLRPASLTAIRRLLSLVSHPKTAYFLEDIDSPDRGVSAHHRHLGDVLTERTAALLDDHAAAVADGHGRQEALWRTTRENTVRLRKTFGDV